MSNISLLQQELNKAIIGRETEIKFMLMGLLVQGHVLLESVPGSGKTMMAKAFAEAIHGEFKRLQFTPDVLPSDVTGISYFHPQKQEFVLRVGPIMSNILLADENSSVKTIYGNCHTKSCRITTRDFSIASSAVRSFFV